MLIELLVRRLEDSGLLLKKRGYFDNININHLAYDSRRVGSNGLFVAIKGDNADGHLFIDKAVQNGAITIVCEAMPDRAIERFPGIAFVHVTNTRAALAELSAAFFGDPSRRLDMVGVTGTNGKTTVCFLVHHILSILGVKSGLLGTIEYRFGEASIAATHTTPDAIVINELLHEMTLSTCSTCVMEVSSHALAQDRVRSIDFDVALFTNLTHDHLDYHSSFQQYIVAKKTLFDNLSDNAFAIYNLDDPVGRLVVKDTCARVVSYGQSKDADIRLDVLGNEMGGLHLRIDGIDNRYSLVGMFNAYNLTAAYGAGVGLGYASTEVIEALITAKPVPGRFEILRAKNGTRVIVDYAHTPDALENVLQTLHQTRKKESSIWCVFGCGGDRDREKRGIMGGIAERYADHTIVTSDNPRFEDPGIILNDIRSGMDHPSNAEWIVDREKAIEAVARMSTAGDIVLIAGKGHETYQVIGSDKLPFDDREVVRKKFSIMD